MVNDENMIKIIEKNLSSTSECANPIPSNREINEFISATDLTDLKDNMT